MNFASHDSTDGRIAVEPVNRDPLTFTVQYPVRFLKHWLGQYDPRPVQPDTLFPVFSVTKGITAGMVHWLVDKGKLKLEDTIADIWPDFGTNGKDLVKVHHVLNHTSGLHNAIGDAMKTNPFILCDWEKCLQLISDSKLESEPGSKQQYHYLSFGWLCGGLKDASIKKFQEVLEETIVRPLNVEGELYIGIPPGGESRLATLALDREDLAKMMDRYTLRTDTAETVRNPNTLDAVKALPVLFNTLNVRRAVIPAANGHASARALARYYATLATSGKVPPPHSSSWSPPLGSHTHIPKFPKKTKKVKKNDYELLDTHDKDSVKVTNLFDNAKIVDEFMGDGDYGGLVVPEGQFGLGFRRFGEGCFGHSGIGGATGFCNVEHQFSIAVTVNKMSLGSITRRVVQLVCAELDVPVPDEFSASGEKGPDMQINLE